MLIVRLAAKDRHEEVLAAHTARGSGRERHGPAARQGRSQLRQDRQVGVEPHPLQPPNPQGRSDHSCFNRPNSRSTAPRWWYSDLNRSVVRGTSGCSRSALTPLRVRRCSPDDVEPRLIRDRNIHQLQKR